MTKEKIPFGYKFFKGFLGVLFIAFYRPKMIGKENIPKEGPILVCCNHMHLYDQCLTILATKRYLRYMAKKEYFDGKMAWFFKCAGCIPVNRQIKDTDAKQAAIDHLKQGGAIGIFPEGTRNKTDQFLLPFKFGAVSMAQKTDAYLVPCAITGKYKFFNNHLTLRIGKPFKVNDMNLEDANKKLEDAIATLKREGIKQEKETK